MDFLDKTTLLTAARSNDLEAAELLLKEQVDMYFKDEKGMTVFHVLIGKRIEMFNSLRETIQWLTADDCNKSQENSKPMDAIAKEVEAAMKQFIELLKKEEKLKRNEKKKFLIDIRQKIDDNERLIVMLLKHKNTDQNFTEEMRLLNFHAACTLKDSSIAEKLLEQQSDINQSVSKECSVYPGYTALHFAVPCNINMVKLLIVNGANLLIPDAEGVTPLESCIKLLSISKTKSILRSVPAWKNMLFTDGKTMFMHYVSCLLDEDLYDEFLKDIDNPNVISLPKDSELWPGYTMLHIAVTLSPLTDLKIIEKTLAHGADVTIQDIHGSTPIHLAFRLEKLQFLELLLKNHVKAVNPVDKDSLSHLHIATAVNRQPLVKKILKIEENFDIVYKGKSLSTVKFGWTPLHTAAHTRHAVVARMLLHQGANLLATDTRGYTAIHFLLGKSYTDKMIEVLLEAKQLKECVVKDCGLSHLHVAAFKNKPKGIERLADLNADLETTIGKLEDENLKKFEGCRPIHITMMDRFRAKAFGALVRKGADVFARKFSESSPVYELLTGEYSESYLSPLVDFLWSSNKLQKRFEKELGLRIIHIACYTFDIEKVKILLKNKVDVNTRTSNDSRIWPGFTPLHILTLAGTKHADSKIDELFKLLLDNGADVTLTNAEGNTPLHVAMKFTCVPERVSFLLNRQRDFSINPANKFGLSHFHLACLLNDVKIVEKFLKQPSVIDVNQPVNSSNKNYSYAGHTPLHCALKLKSEESQYQITVVRLLLERGADVHAVDAFGYTPLHRLARCTIARDALLRKILIDSTDINKRAANGITPIEILLSDGAPSNVINYFIKKGARINSYNPESDVGYMGMVIASKTYKNSGDTNKILGMMIDSPDIAEIDDTNGRNAIHNAVAVQGSLSGYLRYYDGIHGYEGLIDKLIKLGCNIFQQDNQGRTALHLAVKFQNEEAVKALLNCGADINIIDSAGKSAFFYASEFRRDERPFVKASVNSNAPICKLLAKHVKLLQIIGLQVSTSNAALLNQVQKQMIDFYEPWLDPRSKESLKIKICKRGFTVWDLLQPTGLVTMYPSLKETDRDSIDSFFKSSPLTALKYVSYQNCLKGLIKLQYGRALERSSLIAPAEKSLRELVGFPLPNLCMDIVLSHLTNFDIKNMIAASLIPQKKVLKFVLTISIQRI